MKVKGKPAVIIILIVIILSAFIINKITSSKKTDLNVREIKPVIGDIRITVSTTGTVLPKNRLELKSSVAGRIEKILVKEGDEVKTGDVLVLMSSTDRAALIDAARLQGKEALKYWQDAYKPIPIVSPISGTVIVKSVEPGQTVTTTEDIIVISDRLIVKAQVDETDIGRVAEGQKAMITLDSHPEILVKGEVTHIYYESTTVSNVTVYYVVITPDIVPREFRSGMSASIDIIEKEKKNILLVPREAVAQNGGSNYVMIKRGQGKPPEKRVFTPGLSDDQNMEVKEGITGDDTIIISSKKITGAESSSSKNPFMPEPPGAKKR